MKIEKILFIILINSISLMASDYNNLSGELKIGYINNSENNSQTLAIGGNLGFTTKNYKNLSVKMNFFTTNSIAGLNDENSFLGSDNQNYSILNEIYLKYNIWNSTLKIGREIIDTPFADSDNIGMIPNSFEGLNFTNKAFKNLELIISSYHKWSGIDSPKPEKFNKISNNGKEYINIFGIKYKTDFDIDLEAWRYDLDENDLNYYEINYNKDIFNLAIQFSKQEKNDVYGIKSSISDIILNNLSFEIAYNNVNGIVTNGFGGGPFFTSSENYTIAEKRNQKAFSINSEYIYNNFNFGIKSVTFSKDENETDYYISYLKNSISIDLIFSDIKDKILKIFFKYQL